MMEKPIAGTWELEFITPDKAQEYLATMGLNRNEKTHRIASLARYISEGRYRLTHQGIAFNCDGSLKDGQHRLKAVIKASKGIWLWVYRGLPLDAVLVIDTNTPRSDADGLTLSGYQADKNLVALTKRMWKGVSSGHLGTVFDRDDMREFMVRHHQAMTFTRNLFAQKQKGITHASVLATVGRAYYTADHARLVVFADVLKSGLAQNLAEDGAAIRLRDFLISSPFVAGGEGMRALVMRKCEAALIAFLEHRNISKLYEVSEEKFPLPEER